MSVVVIRRTRREWDLSNPILGRNEIGQESHSSRIKIGDGVTTWSGLRFVDDNLEISMDRLSPEVRELLLGGQNESTLDGGAP